MQSDNRFLDDLARVASGALGALTGVREEVEARLRDQFQRILDRMDLVRRDEFEAVQAMAAKARAEQEHLAERVAALEAALAAEPRRKPGRSHASGEGKSASEDQS
ncbi:MAG TPA: accessory factor UbiK family protein [Stellaceae bacterium]|nr:accessory factor UbiK family protein [Stellaceae bacterium]